MPQIQSTVVITTRRHIGFALESPANHRQALLTTDRLATSKVRIWHRTTVGWLRGSVVERRSLAGELSLSCARPVADG